MKRFFWVPCGVLAGLLLLCLLNGARLERCARDWAGQARLTAGLVQQQRWDEAEAQLASLSDNWDGQQDYLRQVLHRDSADDVESSLARCRSLCSHRQETELLAELAVLQTQLAALDELDRPLTSR